MAGPAFSGFFHALKAHVKTFQAFDYLPASQIFPNCLKSVLVWGAMKVVDAVMPYFTEQHLGMSI